jgi:hypothetical protein
VLFAACLFISTSTALADQPFDVIVAVNSTRVMADEKPIGEVRKGTRLTVSETSGDWYLVDVPGINPPQQGWVRKSDIHSAAASKALSDETPISRPSIADAPS